MTTTPPSSRLSFKEKLAYGLGDTASNFYFQAFNLFLSYYYTDVVGIKNAAAVGTLLGTMPILVALLNPVIGVAADRTQSRWGKFRPWILWGAVPYGVLGFIMFAMPDLADSGKLAYAYVTYTLMLVAYAAINTPYGALMGVMSPSSEDRTSLSSYRFACAFLGALLIGWLVPGMKNALAFGGAPEVGFRNTMAIFAVLSIGMFIYTFLNTKERVVPPPSQQGSLRQDLRDLFSNGPWLVLFFVAFLNLTNVGLRSGAGIYYFKYVVNNEAAIGTFNLVGFLCFILGALATKLFTARWSRRSLMIWLTIINAAGIGGCYFVDPHNLTLLYVLNIIGSFAAGPTPAIVWSLYADTADYGEWKFSRRATGLIFSATVMVQKIGLAIGGGLIGWLLSYYGYVANAVQTPRAIHGITLLFAALPGVFALLAGAAIIFYPLDEPQVKRMEAELASRKGAAA